MRILFDKMTIYMFSDDEIMSEICRRLRVLRQNNCISQTAMAKLSGVSLSTVKRIESGKISDVNFGTIIKILRAGGLLDGVADLVEEVPAPAIKENKRGYFSKSMRP